MHTVEKSLVCFGSLLVALVCFSDTARAQNGTLTATPPQLTFSAQTGSTPPTQTLTITSSNGPTNVTVSAFSGNNWLSVTPNSGKTPLQLTVSVNPALSSLATDIGFLNISAAGAFLPVPVELDVNEPGPSPLSASPNSLSFTFAPNSTVPVTKPLTISSEHSSVTSFTATAITNDGGNWLTVNPTGGNLPNTIQVTAIPTALTGTGPFRAVVAINAPGTTGISVPVLVTLSGTPAIVVSPAQLNFAWQIGTAAPAAETLSITSSTGANVSFTASSKTSSCGNWLVISPQNGATPGNISAQVNTSGLVNPQQCEGEIDIHAPGASNPDVSVQVTLLVSTNPLLLVPSTGPSFTYQIGTSAQLAVQNVQITSSGTPLNFTASAAPTTAGGPNFLTVNPPAGTTSQALALTVNPAVLTTLGPGVYSETVTVASAGAGNSPQTFIVTLTVNSNPILVPTVQSLTFNFEVGQALPPNQTFTVASTGAPLNFQVTTDTSNCTGFLSATGFNGASGLTYQDQNQVLVSVSPGNLAPQVCSGHITLTVPNSNSPAQVIPVTLNISNKALLNVSTNVINVTALVGGAISTPQISVTSTDPGTVLNFTATAATNPIGLTWLSVTPNTGNTPNNLLVTINPQNLGVGTYPGTITVSSPNVPSQTIQVKLTVASSNISSSLAKLAFAQTLGGTPPAPQTIQITGVPPGTTIGAIPTLFNGTGWLQATVNGNAITVTADGSALTQGTFSGVLTVIVPGAGNSPLFIPVTLMVSATIPNALVLSATTASFSFQAGGVVPTSQTIQLTSATPVPFTATFVPGNGGNFLTVTPTSGTTPATLTLAINGTLLNTIAQGTYTGNVVVSSPSLPGGDQTIKVTFTVAAGSGPAITSIVNAASFLHGPISPGELITIFGNNLGPNTGLLFTPDNGHVDTTLDDTVVMFNNTAAPLIYVSATQINAIVPYEVASNSSVNVTVTHSHIVSATFMAAVANTAPGIFSANQTGNGQGAILNSNLGANSANNPAPAGSVVSLYATGEGVLTPPVATGSMSGPSLPLPVPVAHVSVTIDGEPADISYAGEAPTLVSGVLQINAKIPNDLHSGNHLVVVTIGANSTKQQAITVAVQ